MRNYCITQGVNTIACLVISGLVLGVLGTILKHTGIGIGDFLLDLGLIVLFVGYGYGLISLLILLFYYCYGKL
jgi:hypothetical protein